MSDDKEIREIREFREIKETKTMSWMFHIVALVPIVYIASAFYLGYFVVLAIRLTNVSLLFGVLLTLIISSAGVSISVALTLNHYWTTMKIVQQWGRPGLAEKVLAGEEERPGPRQR